MDIVSGNHVTSEAYRTISTTATPSASSLMSLNNDSDITTITASSMTFYVRFRFTSTSDTDSVTIVGGKSLTEYDVGHCRFKILENGRVFINYRRVQKVTPFGNGSIVKFTIDVMKRTFRYSVVNMNSVDNDDDRDHSVLVFKDIPESIRFLMYSNNNFSVDILD